MADRRVLRIVEAGSPAFQLRKGEEGISVFDPDAVTPPLADSEILSEFRQNSHILELPITDVENKGLTVIPVEGAESLTLRLRQAHAEIRPGAGMTRRQFKVVLKELE